MASPKITISIGANTRGLKKDLNKAEGIVGSFTRNASNALLGMSVVAAAAAVKIGIDGVKGAIEDAKAQATLAKTLQNTTKATAGQIKANEDYITRTMFLTGVLDDELRPSLDRLVRSTHNVKEAQHLQSLALNISAGSGKSLATVTEALAKAHDGNFLGLKKLGVPLSDAIVKTKNFDLAQQSLAATFNGQASAAAQTMDGKLKRLNARWGEAKESIGNVIIEGLQPLLNWMTGAEGQKVMDVFVKGFAEAFKEVAKSLPSIIKGFESIAKTAGNMNLSWKDLMNPQMLAAAAAFRYMPGGIQFKAIAALAAYFAADPSNAPYVESTNKTGLAKSQPYSAANRDAFNREVQSNVLGGKAGGLALGNARSVLMGTYKPRTSYTKDIYGIDFNPTKTVDNSVHITVNGAIDPKSVASQIQYLLIKGGKLGITSAIGRGN
jgi:hypothetical protein